MFDKIVIFINLLCLFVLSASIYASDNDVFDTAQNTVLTSSVAQVFMPSPFENTEQKQKRPTTYGALDVLPKDLIGCYIFKYCDNNILQVNTSFFTLGTGYTSDHILDQGFDSKPNRHHYPIKTNREINFYNIDSLKISSSVWYNLVSKISGLTSKSWFYLQYLKKSQIQEISFFEFVPIEKMPEFGQALEGTYVHTLKFVDNSTMTSVEIEELIKCLEKTNIKRLTLMNASYCDPNFDVAKENHCNWLQNLSKTKIHTLNLSTTFTKNADIQDLAQALPKTKVEILSLSYNDIRDSGITALAQALPKTKIHTLTLSNNDINDSGITVLAQMLPATRIHTLNLTEKIEKIGFLSLGQILAKTQLRILIINRCKVGIEEIYNLCENFQQTEIYKLDLSDNDITDSVAEKLGSYLQKSNVQSLILDRNKITEVGVKDLVQNLHKSHVLRLSLYKNEIGDENLTSLGRNLKNTKIQNLNLSCNKITSIGAYSLLEALVGSCLLELNLSFNKINGQNIDRFAQSFKYTFIHTLNLNSNHLTIVNMKEVIEGLKGSCITKLYIGGSNHKQEKVDDFITSLKNVELLCLDLYKTGITNDCTEHLISILQTSSIKTLGLTFNSIFDKKDLLRKCCPQTKFFFYTLGLFKN